MHSLEEFGKTLYECLADVRSLLERAHEIAVEEQHALIKNDIETVTSTSTSQDEILRRIIQADQRAASVAEQIAQTAGLKTESVNMDTIADVIGEPYKNPIIAGFTDIRDASKKLKDVNTINSRLLKNGMDIITSLMRTITRDNTPNTYRKDAGMTDHSCMVLSLDWRV